jgi:hypothetical protein
MPGVAIAPQAAAARATNRVTIEPFRREMAVRANSFNAEQRTFEVVWSTGAEGRRYGWCPTGEYVGEWIEELGMEPENVDLSRLNNGAPLCDSHNWGSLHGSSANRGVVGVTERAWLDAGSGIASVRLSAREDVAPIARDVQDGILRKTSIGYEVTEWEETTTPDDARAGTRRFKAMRWMPFEISLVSVPFDDGAGVRSQREAYRYQSLVHFAAQPAGATRTNPDPNMPPDPVNPAPAAPAADPIRTATPAAAAPTPAAPEPAARAVSLAAVRTHVRRNNLGQQFEDTIVDDLTSGRCTQEAANQRILDALAARSEATPINNVTRVLPDTVDQGQRDAVTAALLHRHNPQQNQLPEAGRRFRSRSLLEIARTLVEARGIRTDEMERSQIVARAMSSSDFPFITADVANKVLRQAYQAQPRTFMGFSRRTTLVDFKSKYSNMLGDAPALLEVPTGGEVKAGKISEARESYKLKTYARKIGLTRENIINDDLDAFTKLASRFGTSAVALENDVVWALLTAGGGVGATMSDTLALFHATHANLGSGGTSVLSVDGLSLARVRMRKQKGLDAANLLNLAPAFLLVPAALETKAKQLTTQVNSIKDTDVNPFVGAFSGVVTEPRLDAISATAWILVASPDMIDTLEYAYLEGSEGVRVETQEGWNTLGVELRAVHDFGAGLIDFRGFDRSAGA